jgi:catechol 2,3-dioxygenase-like lactoylglutathione lyase family enzyme
MSDDLATGGNVRAVCVDHMTFPVGDLERSLAFYRAALVDGMGWNEIDEEGAPAFGPSTRRATTAPSCSISMATTSRPSGTPRSPATRALSGPRPRRR